MIKKSIYEQIGGFDPKITACEDYDFQNKLNRNGFKIGFIIQNRLYLSGSISSWRISQNLESSQKYYNFKYDDSWLKKELRLILVA